MDKIGILFKLSLKFTKLYLIQYIKLLIKPIILGIVGFFAIFLSYIHPILAIIALFISIPCCCYAFWRGFIITYALNIAAYYFIKKNANVTLEGCYKLALSKEKDFAMYILFLCGISLLGFVPCIIFFIIGIFKFMSKINILELQSSLTQIASNSESYIYILLILVTFLIAILYSILLLPFCNYATQAYLFKKSDENYFSLFLNCYKKLNLTGFLIMVIIIAVNSAINLVVPYLYIFLFIPMNVFVYSINTFWYYTRVNKKLT